MNRLYAFVIVCLLFGSGVTSAQAEVINDFHVTYQINPDATVIVKEIITYDFEGVDRHGIFRTIKNRHPQAASAWYKNRIIDIKIQRVLKDGKPEPFEVTTGFTDIEIKVGDPDVTTSGQHVYQIEYQLVGALSYGPSGAEFYFNVTGNEWPVVIENTKATVYSRALTGTSSCYAGVVGSTNRCDENLPLTGLVSFSQTQLLPGEGLTIATAFDKPLVANVILEKNRLELVLFIFIPLVLLGMTVIVYRFKRKNLNRRPVIAQYEPFPYVLPMYTGVLIDGRLDSRDISAGILYLAQQGYIKIWYTKEKIFGLFTTHDYEVTLLKIGAKEESRFQDTLLRLLFLDLTVVGSTVTLGALKQNSIQRQLNAAEIIKLRTALTEDLRRDGFFETPLSGIKMGKIFAWTTISWVVSLFVVSLFFGTLYNVAGFLVTFILVTVVVTLVLVSSRRSKLGFEAQNHLKGFKLFLSVTDKERFEFHNAPPKNAELFMKYLPYAVALGVEKKWVEVFADISIPPPDWYGGNINTFSAAAFTSDLGTFSTSFAASALAASGTGGSSGGGFSGGGGGKGGGGSW